MPQPLQRFLFALTFLTRIPFAAAYDYTDDLPAHSMRYYPLIGLIIGFILIAVNYLASLIFPLSVVNIFIMITLIYITGGIHLDGFIDTVDGFFGGNNRQDTEEIMHDSLVGSFGVLAVILLILLKFFLLLELKGQMRLPLLLLMPVLGRWMIVYAACCYPLAKSSKLARLFSAKLGTAELIWSSIWLILIALIINIMYGLAVITALIIFAVSLGICLLLSKYAVKRLGGLNGDLYGTINEVTEVIVLLSFIGLGNI